MARGTSSSDTAGRLQILVRARGEYGHVTVRAQGGHLLIQVEDASGQEDVVARASSLGGGQYGLSFKSHTGKWQPLPVQGTLEDIAQGLTELLGPYLDPDNLA
jgi:hypothetical protein